MGVDLYTRSTYTRVNTVINKKENILKINIENPAYSDVVHQVIWNNKFINVQKVSLHEEYMFLKGIVTVGDLLSDTGSFLKGLKVLNANLSPVEHFKLMSIVNAIPWQWKLIIRQSTQHITSYISDIIYLKMGNFDEVALSEVSSKKLYEAFRNKKQVPPTAQTKLKEKFTHFSVDWKEIYSLPFTVTIETKIREFLPSILPSRLKILLPATDTLNQLYT